MKRLISLLVIALIATSCGPLRAAKDAAISCAKEDVTKRYREDALPLVSEVAGILLDGGDGWKDALAKLGGSVGDSALACAVRAVEAGHASIGFSGPDASTLAASYIAERGWKFKQ